MSHKVLLVYQSWLYLRCSSCPHTQPHRNPKETLPSRASR